MSGPGVDRTDVEKRRTFVMSTAVVIAITLCVFVAVISGVMVQKKKQ